MPRVRLRLEGSSELLLLKLAADAAWPALLDAVQTKLGLAAGAQLALSVHGARVTSADDLDENDEVLVAVVSGGSGEGAPRGSAHPSPPAPLPSPRAPSPPPPPPRDAEAAASKKAAKKARQRERKAREESDDASVGLPPVAPKEGHAAADLSSFPLVALDAANIGHSAAGGAFNWANVASAIEHYALRGVRAVPITKRASRRRARVPTLRIRLTRVAMRRWHAGGEPAGCVAAGCDGARRRHAGFAGGAECGAARRELPRGG
jgi:hypothetical protein